MVHPAERDASFVWRMEDVLEVYTRPYDERFPQVCLDEKSKQLLAEVREPLSVRPGHRPVRITSTSATGRPTSSSFRSLWLAGATSASPSDERRSTGRIA